MYRLDPIVCLFLFVLVSAIPAGLAAAPAEPGSGSAIPGELAPIRPQTLTLRSLPAHPGAPAVVVRKRGTLRFADGSRQPRSTLDVEVRIKVLTEAGKGFGQVTLAHGRGLELVAFEGRTIRADGSFVAVPADAVFHQDQARRRAATNIAFPAVEIGAIIDYRYRLAWNAPIYPDPWFFDDRIPTLESTFIYERPSSVEVLHHVRQTGVGRYDVARESLPRGGERIRIRLEGLPAVADEPSGFPFADLAHCVWLVTERVVTGEGWMQVADDWRAQVAGYAAGYASARRFDRDTRRRAKQLTAKVGGARAKAEAIYRFVRETMQPVEGPLGVGEGVTVDQILRARQGTSTEIALLLVTMLEASGVPARMVWAADWRDGTPRTDIVRIGWFTKALVEARLAGEPVYLDAGDRRLGMGRLAPTQEGTAAIVLDRPQPREVTLPKTLATDSTRRAELDLSLDADGRLSGRGTLTLRGHHAWFFLRRRESHEAVVAGWERWLADRFPGFEITAQEVDEQVDAARITVSWTMVQETADVLGDEASLRPSLPWGPLEQRYTLPAEARKTPVRVSFADRDELVLDLSWSAGWQPEIVPAELSSTSRAGHARARTEVDLEARRLRYERVVQIDDTVYFPGDSYRYLRDLYAAVEGHDAQPLVLYLEP